MAKNTPATPVATTVDAATTAAARTEIAQALANSDSATQRAAQRSEAALEAVVDGIAGTEPALRVVARPPTFRRAGFEFGPEPVTLRLADLTGAQIDAIEAESELVCTRVFIPEVKGDSEAQA